MEEIISDLLSQIGEDLERPGLADTPKRVAKAWKEWTRGYQDFPGKITTFPSDYKGILARKSIPFSTLCEHHMAYFGGEIDFGYIPNGQIVGISKIIRMMQHYSARLTTQEDLVMLLADKFTEATGSHDVVIHLRALHTCECSRGVSVHGVETITMEKRGVFAQKPEKVDEFFHLLN